MKKIDFLLLLSLILVGFSQCALKSIKVLLKPIANHEDGPLGSTYAFTEIVVSDSSLSNLAQQLNLYYFEVRKFNFYPEVSKFNDFKSGKIDSSAFFPFEIDTNMLIQENGDFSALIMVGKTQSGEAVIIPDVNNNNYLKDDSVYFLKGFHLDTLKPEVDKLPAILFKNFFVSKNNRNYKMEMIAKVLPFKKTSSPEIEVKQNNENYIEPIFLISNAYLKGNFRVKGKKYKIAIRNRYPKLTYDKRNTIITIANEDKEFKSFPQGLIPQKIRDSIYIGSYKFLIDRISLFGDTLYLSFLGKEKKLSGFNLGDRVENFVYADLISNQKYQLLDLLSNKKYLLIDFWGTWCIPCIEAFPNLKSKAELFAHNVRVLGVIYDDSAYLIKAKDLIRQYGLFWNQYFVDRRSSPTLVDKLRIRAFPTYMLVDSNRRIVFRGEGEMALEEVFKILQNAK